MKLVVAALFAAVCAGWVPLVVAQDVVPAAPVPQEERVVFPASVAEIVAATLLVIVELTKVSVPLPPNVAARVGEGSD